MLQSALTSAGEVWSVSSLERSVQVGGWGNLARWVYIPLVQRRQSKSCFLLIWASALISCHRCSCLSVSVLRRVNPVAFISI